MSIWRKLDLLFATAAEERAFVHSIGLAHIGLSFGSFLFCVAWAALVIVMPANTSVYDNDNSLPAVIGSVAATCLQTIVLATWHYYGDARSLPLWVRDALVLLIMLGLLAIFSLPNRVGDYWSAHLDDTPSPGTNTGNVTCAKQNLIAEHLITTHNKLVFFGVLYMTCGFMRACWSWPLALAISTVGTVATSTAALPNVTRTTALTAPLIAWVFASAHERTLRRAQTSDLHNLHLQRLAQEKDGFLATMSHEMKTPLNGLLGFLQVRSVLITPWWSAALRAHLAKSPEAPQHQR